MKLLDALLTKLAGTSYGMGPVTHRRVDETRAVPVPMRDGVTLLTDIFQPAGATGLPVLLLRTPYGRRQLGGMTELLPSAFNDVDLCMKSNVAGRTSYWTPHAELYHFESKSRDPSVRRWEVDIAWGRWASRMHAPEYWPYPD